MSTRALVRTAVLLTLLLAGSVALLVHRLGYFSQWETPSFTFTNPLLGIAKGQRFTVRPLQPGVAWARYFFTTPTVEPDPEKGLFPAPYVPVGLEERTRGVGDWVYVRVQFFVLGQMGAMSVKEWLEEIRPVRERGRDGVERTVLRARFGHEAGGGIDYFIDPDNLVPGLGWYRHELRAEERPPAIFFGSDGGKVDVD